MQLDRNGAAINNGEVVNKETNAPLEITPDMSSAEQAVVAESLVIGKQIINYQEMQQLSQDMVMAEVNVKLADEGSKEKTEAEAKLSNLESRYELVEKKEQELITNRTEINAVQAEQDVRAETVKIQEIQYLPEDRIKIDQLQTKINEAKHEAFEMEQSANASDDIGKWKQEMSQVDTKNESIERMEKDLAQLKADAAYNAEHPDERRGERVDEHDKGQHTMEEWKAKIADEKAKMQSQSDGVKDHQFHRDGKVGSKDHGDR